MHQRIHWQSQSHQLPRCPMSVAGASIKLYAVRDITNCIIVDFEMTIAILATSKIAD